MIADRLVQIWGQQIIIDNRPSAGGNAGTAAAANAPADGYNLLFAQAAPIVSSQFLFKEMPFNPEKQLVPIVGLGVSPMMLAVNPALKANSLSELVALIEKHLGRKAILNRQPMQPGDVQRTCADVAKARRLLGYNPATTMDEGVRAFVAWYHALRASAS